MAVLGRGVIPSRSLAVEPDVKSSRGRCCEEDDEDEAFEVDAVVDATVSV